jgi:hypothetical protein
MGTVFWDAKGCILGWYPAPEGNCHFGLLHSDALETVTYTSWQVPSKNTHHSSAQ